jgi:putrescine transport system permease protein
MLLAVPWFWLALSVMAPIVIVVAIALAQPADGIPPYHLGFSPDNLTLVLTDPLYRDALLLSLWVAGISTTVCLLIGYPMALAIARSHETWRDTLLLAVMLPFWTGFLMRINAWIGLLADDDWINAALTWIGVGPLTLLYSSTAMYVGITYTYLPFMVLPLYAQLSRLDPTLVEAASDLGAPPWRVFLRVTLPLSMPGIAAGCALVFIPTVGEYIIPELLGGPGAALIGRVLWGEFFSNRDWPTAAAVAVCLLVLLLVVPAAVSRLVARGRGEGGHGRQSLGCLIVRLVARGRGEGAPANPGRASPAPGRE